MATFEQTSSGTFAIKTDQLECFRCDNHPFCNTMESQKLVMNAVKSNILLTSSFTQPRNYSSKRVVSQLWAISAQKTTQQNKNLTIAGYNLRTNVWTIWDTPIEFRSGFAVALMGEDLIVVGGTSNDIPINAVMKLNLRTMVSSELAPLRTSRTNHALAVLNGAIYVIGGYNGRRILNSVERWDPVNRTWDIIPLMKNARQDPAVAVINDRLYVSGGVCGINILTSVECYDPVENTWISAAPMKEKRHSHCLAAHKGYLFAFGGLNGAGRRGFPLLHSNIFRYKNYTSERYDPRTNIWTEISFSPGMSLFTKCASLGNELFIYNDSAFYTVSDEGSCDNLQLQTLNKPTDTFTSFECKELVAIPFEFSPPRSSIRNKDF